MNPVDANAFKYDYLATDAKAIQRSISNRLVYSIGKDPFTATDRDWLHALCAVVRDRLIERWMETQRSYYRHDAKRVYYLSLEFLIGRSLANAMLNLDFMDRCTEALDRLGLNLERLCDLEHDAALGNGGLGRLAACLLDSMATLGIPGYGYGIRYEYGMFRQQIEDGEQVELPENWLAHGNPWEFCRPEVCYEVHFGGRVVEYTDGDGRRCHQWLDAEKILAQAFDTPIPGHQNDTVNNLRLWSAKAPQDFDLEHFNRGDYLKAVEDKALSENLSKVLYPNDTSVLNRELRLKQQYFFVSASLQDIVRRFAVDHEDLRELPEKVSIQLNDTHPSIAIPEMMRLLVDEYRMEWPAAWEATVRTFSYTNHTLLPEALESWPVGMLERLLPRHMQIIFEINKHFLMTVVNRHPGDIDLMRRMSLIEEGWEKRVRMAHLAIVGSHKVNGVSALHTQLLREETFGDFERFFPGRIVNITNGISPRRWLKQANPGLAGLITEAIGPQWASDLDQLRELVPLADDAVFRERFRAVKLTNKERLARLIGRYLGHPVDPLSLFDVQVKRIHEYKRQLLNLLRVVALYNRYTDNPGSDFTPLTVLIGGKAAPGYYMAKLIIRLTHDVGRIIDADSTVAGRLKLLFVPNYDVTTASDIIPAADLSQQISTAGMEASGTGNMKLALNGALTIGTMDGANVEIREQVGAENIFIFGLHADQVEDLRRRGYRPRDFYESDVQLRRVVDMIGNGYFSPEEPERYRPIVESLLGGGDRFMVLADFRAYLECLDDVDRVYRDSASWDRRAVLNTALMGHFASDRTVREYAEKIWGVTPVAAL